MQPSPGKFEFEWMDNAIELAAMYGIKVILCTPAAHDLITDSYLEGNINIPPMDVRIFVTKK